MADDSHIWLIQTRQIQVVDDMYSTMADTQVYGRTLQQMGQMLSTSTEDEDIHDSGRALNVDGP